MSENRRFAVADLIDDFRVHLQAACGFSCGTIDRYTTHARDFLQWKSSGEIDLAGIGPADLIAFVSEYAFKHKPKTSKLAISALRSFLRFLQLKGLSNTLLVNAVPTVPAWKLSSLPASLSAAQVDLLLGVFDRTTRNGQRGYAIAQCMLVLGLRAGEVAHLSLDDINWRTGVVGIPKTKARRIDKLPLPAVVGNAVVKYLSAGRPHTLSRRVFVRHIHPTGEAISSSAVSQIIRRAFGRSGMNNKQPEEFTPQPAGS